MVSVFVSSAKEATPPFAPISSPVLPFLGGDFFQCVCVSAATSQFGLLGEKNKHVCSAAATFDAFSRFNWSTLSPSQQTASRLIVDLLELKGDAVNGLFPIKSLCV